MEGTLTATPARPAPRKRGPSRYWAGFTVCLFIVLLSVFTWVVQRRITQYESLQQTGGHHMSATKVCLTDRNQISLPSTHEMDGAGIFAAAIVQAGALFREDDSQQSPFHAQEPRHPRRARATPWLAHFFFLPPPSLSHSL